MKNDMVSIIVPIYNVEKYIKECIESLINQDYDNYEVILVDDGSTDNSLNICKKYENNKHVTIITQKNSGVSVARNTGMKNAKGKWICFVDGDDFMQENAISNFVNNVSDDVDILITPPVMEYENISIDSPIFESDIVFSDKNKIKLVENIICRQFKKDFNSDIGAGGPWGKLYKRSFILDNSLEFIVGLKRMQDVIFNLYAVKYAHKIKYKNIYSYHYRINNNSSTIKFNPKIFDTFNNVLFYFYEFAESYNNISEELLQSIYMKTILLYIEGARIGIVNQQNSSSYINKIKNLKEIYNSIEFNKGFKKIDYKYLDIKTKLFTLCVNLHLFNLVYLMIYIFINSKHKEQS